MIDGNKKDKSTSGDDRYLIDVSGFALANNESISDIRLAARLNHEKDQATDVLCTTIDGQGYTLRIVGDIFIEDGNGFLKSCDLNKDEELLVSVESSNVYEDFIDASMPYFEWVSDSGDAIGSVFDEISVYPAKEIEKFKTMLDGLEEDHGLSGGIG